jgi:prolipoprotein diacylglyceryltransferase
MDKEGSLPLWSTLDALTPFFAVFALGLGLAHLASGSAFGKETTLPWGIELWGAVRHPSQVYEILASLLILGLLWFQRADARPGLHFLTFAALTSGCASLFLEAFRGDSTLDAGRLASSAGYCMDRAGTIPFLFGPGEKPSFTKVVTRSEDKLCPV